MQELIITSLIWALSFSLIGQYISPNIDPYLAVLIRVVCGLMIFTPFIKKIKASEISQLMLVGALQFGITYLLLYQSYRYIGVIEILLFTTTTPLYIVFLHNLYYKTLNYGSLLLAAAAVIGALIIRYHQISTNVWFGFMLIQLANLSFASGQVLYQIFAHKTVAISTHIQNYHRFFWFFVGALLIALPAFILLGTYRFAYSHTTMAALLFVGIIATSLGQFLWCKGATKASNSQLSIMNNLVIPLGIGVSLFFGERIHNVSNFFIGSSIIVGALIISSKIRHQQKTP